MSVVETRGTWGDGFIKGLAAKFFEVENQADQAYSLGINSATGVEANNYTRLFKEKSSDKARETITNKTGVGYPRLTDEGDDYYADSRLPGYKVQFNFKKFTSSIEVTEEEKDDMENDLADKLDEAADLYVGMKMKMDKTAFDVFNYAFTAQASLPEHLTFYSDGVPLASVQHPRRDGGATQSNASATGITLTEPNLRTARQALRRQLDDRGLPMNIGSGRLILLVPDSLEDDARVLTDSVLRPNTANNDINVFDGSWVTVISTKWINSQNGGSDTAWFLIDSMYSPFIFFNRQGVRTSTYRDNKNKNIVHDISARWQVGNKNWRGFYASPGDGAAYAL